MSNTSRGCLKTGCFGCLGLIVLAILGVFVLSALGHMAGDREADPVDVQVSHPLTSETETTASGTPPNAEEDTLPLEAVVGATDQTQMGTLLPLDEPLTTPPPRPGRLEIDLAYGDFRIRRAAPGESLGVEARYDASSFELEEVLTEDEDGWKYKVSFGAKGGFLGLLMRAGVQKGDNRVVITIPADYPFDLAGKMGIGELEADLGGLWIREVDLDLGVGDQTLSFAAPTREPMERFAVVGSVGEISIEDLGNASPQQVYFEHSVGESRLDLSGAWQNDAEVRASFSVGEMRLRIPDDVKVVLSNKRISIGEISAANYERPELGPEAHTLTLDIDGSVGEISVD